MNEYRICSRCVMDTSDPFIEFDTNGVCNHCRNYELKIKPLLPAPEKAREAFDEIIRDIKRNSRNNKYDCILGISGGVDSSYLAYLAKENGLRVLLVHMDNCWDSELAVNNIENIVKKTGFDYYNYIIDWEEFRDLQLAYLRASVIDIEVVTDHAIAGLIYKVADENNIKYILNGSNHATEAIMPSTWSFCNKGDLANLKAIHEKYGNIPLKTYPTFGVYKRFYYTKIKDIKDIPLLNYIDYNAIKVKKILNDVFGWREYKGKHYESVFTGFYQSYILPRKFNADKRRAHLANLICSGQITRNDALELLKKELCTEQSLKEELNYVLSKLSITNAEFEEIMHLPPVSHYDFPVDELTHMDKFKLFFWGFVYNPFRKVREIFNESVSQLRRPRVVKLEIFSHMYEAYIKRTWEYLGVGKGGKPMHIAIYGNGSHTQWLFSKDQYYTFQKPVIAAILDDNPDGNESFWGIKPVKPEMFNVSDIDLILISSDVHNKKMAEKCRKLFQNNTRILDLYEGFPVGPYIKA